MKPIDWAHTAARHSDRSQRMDKGEKRLFQGLPFSGGGLTVMAVAEGSGDGGGQEVRTRLQGKRVGLFRENPFTPSL